MAVDHRRPAVTTQPSGKRRKFYVDGGQVEIAAHLVYELDPQGNQLTGGQVHRLHCGQGAVAVPQRRRASQALGRCRRSQRDHRRPGRPGHRVRRIGRGSQAARRRPVRFALPLGLQRPACGPGGNGPSGSAPSGKDFFDKFGPEARYILEELLEKYAEHGITQFSIPEILDVPPISEHGNVLDIVSKFGGVDRLREAVAELQTLLYAAA